MKNILAIIPARAGSKRLPGKNIKKLCGVPLIGYTIQAAVNSQRINKIVVSTNDDAVAAQVEAYPQVRIIRRPDELATDEAKTITAMMHALKFLEENDAYKAELVVLLQLTCPLREKGFIDKAVEMLLNSDADSLLSVSEERFKLGDIKDGYFFPAYEEGLRKQDILPRYRENGALYISTAENIKSGRLFGKKILPYITGKFNAVNIDTQFDFDIAESMLAKYKEQFKGGAW